MPETRLTVSAASRWVGSDIKNNVVRVSCVSGEQAGRPRYCFQSIAFSHVIQIQDVAHAPGDVVVGAGGVSADADSAYEFCGPQRKEAGLRRRRLHRRFCSAPSDHARYHCP